MNVNSGGGSPKIIYLLPLPNKSRKYSSFILFHRLNSEFKSTLHHYLCSRSLYSSFSVVCSVAGERMLNSMLSDIVCRASTVCCVCVHEGVKLLHIRERKSWSNRKQLVLNEAFDFPALENPMLSRWQQKGGGGEAFSSICDLACDTKATHCPLCFPVLTAAPSVTFKNGHLWAGIWISCVLFRINLIFQVMKFYSKCHNIL